MINEEREERQVRTLRNLHYIQKEGDRARLLCSEIEFEPGKLLGYLYPSIPLENTAVSSFNTPRMKPSFTLSYGPGETPEYVPKTVTTGTLRIGNDLYGVFGYPSEEGIVDYTVEIFTGISKKIEEAVSTS